MTHVKQLQNIGLKRPEAEIYLACLRLGLAKVSEIAREVNLPRTSIYGHINALTKRGCLNKTKKQGVEYFSPISPEAILQEQKEKLRSFSSVVPTLEKLLDFPKKKPKIEYFDTNEGMFKLYENILLKTSPAHPFFFIESGEALRRISEKNGMNFWHKWQKKFLEKRLVAQGVSTKDIIPYLKNLPKDYKEIFIQRAITVKLVDEKEFPFSINLYLIPSALVYILIPQENLVIVIENKAIYDLLLIFYKLLSEKGEYFNLQTIIQ